VGLLKRFFSKTPGRDRIFVLGLDGVSHAMVSGELGRYLVPNLAGLLTQGSLLPMRSVLPTMSSVAWATYFTGVNPAKHGIFGFVDRHPDPFQAVIPTARDLKSLTLWEHLSRYNHEIGVMGVPLTYPPKQVNGFMVGCFFSPDLASATYPVELAPRLMEMDYRLDADTSLARENLDAFLADLDDTVSRRFLACRRLMAEEPWDFFQLNIISTDRINHFLWGGWEDGDEDLARAFTAFYRRLDAHIAELIQDLPDGCHLVVLSDHGFTRSAGVVYLNQWLEANGYLLLGMGKKELRNMHAETRAYSLAPGRIYINLEGREERGRVPSGRPYEDLREELIHRLGGLAHPETNQPLVRAVHKREDIYHGAHLSRAADLIIEPEPGFDFKADLGRADLVGRDSISGTHTLDDAFFFVHDTELVPAEPTTLLDAAPTILDLIKLPAPEAMDGQSLL